LYCTKTDDPTDNFRFKMVETDALACLVRMRQDENINGHLSSIEVITALAEFGTLIYHFVLCED
jgi:hypothetical protein